REVGTLPRLGSTVAMEGPCSVSFGRDRCTCFGGGSATLLQPAGGAAAVVLPPPPPPHPASSTTASETAAPVRPEFKAPKPTQAPAMIRASPPEPITLPIPAHLQGAFG